MPMWAQWAGFIVTVISGLISAFVLYQAYQLKDIFLLKAKLPKLHEHLTNHRKKFNKLLSEEPLHIKSMEVVQAEVISILNQAKPQLSKIDSVKIDKALEDLSKDITNYNSSWHFYKILASLEQHISSSSEDLKWKS